MVIGYKKHFDNFKSDPLVRKIGNLLMRHGKKTKAEVILQKIFYTLNEHYPGQALKILYLALFNAQHFSNIKVRPQSKKYRRFSVSKNTGTPFFITGKQGQNMCIRSIFMLGGKYTSNTPLWQNLSQEIVFVATNKSDIIVKSYNSHSLSRLNRRQYNFRFTRKFPHDPECLFAGEDSYISKTSVHKKQ